MAVYTDVPDDELQKFAAQYALGEIVSCKGIAEGVENSNYLLRTETGIFILTLYEKRVDPKDLPFFIGLMEHLAARGLACPTPVHGSFRTRSPFREKEDRRTVPRDRAPAAAAHCGNRCKQRQWGG